MALLFISSTERALEVPFQFFIPLGAVIDV
jgi:hypothetical protein